MKIGIFVLTSFIFSAANAYVGQPKRFECNVNGGSLSWEISDIELSKVKIESIPNSANCSGTPTESLPIHSGLSGVTLAGMSGPCLTDANGNFNFTGDRISMSYEKSDYDQTDYYYFLFEMSDKISLDASVNIETEIGPKYSEIISEECKVTDLY
jgi:hypothetical protein